METADFYYRARMMDSSTGSFTSKDIFKLSNRYTYVGNQPLIFIDISGQVAVASQGGDVSNAYTAKKCQDGKEMVESGQLMQQSGNLLLGGSVPPGVGNIVTDVLTKAFSVLSKYSILLGRIAGSYLVLGLTLKYIGSESEKRGNELIEEYCDN